MAKVKVKVFLNRDKNFLYIRDKLKPIVNDVILNHEYRFFEHIEDKELYLMKDKAKFFKDNYDTFIIIGVGGSNTASRSIITAIKKYDSIDTYYAGNTLSPIDIKKILDIVDERNVCINIIAKNFKTLEPGIHFRLIREKMIKKYGIEETKKRIVVTGTCNSILHKISLENGYTFLKFRDNIGGRYSCFSEVNLFPMLVNGLSISEFIKGMNDLKKDFISGNIDTLLDYISYRIHSMNSGKFIEVLSSTTLLLKDFNRWFIQLFGESEGKNKHGIYPDAMCFSEDLHSMGQFIQDGNPIVMETFLRISDYGMDISVEDSSIDDDFSYLLNKKFSYINNVMIEATKKAHLDDNIPICEITIDKLDEYNIGAIMYFFIISVISSSIYQNIDPYTQDAVENYKNNMFRELYK